jgi:hypothetical protein
MADGCTVTLGIAMGNCCAARFVDNQFHLEDQLMLSLVGIAHRAVKDDVYNGMRIPNGSIVIGNVW